MATDAPPKFISVIPSLAQCEKASNFLNALKQIFATHPQLCDHMPRMCDFQHDGEYVFEYPHSAFLFIHSYFQALKSALAVIGLNQYEIIFKHCKDLVEGMEDAAVRRMIIEGAFADSTTRRVEFEPHKEAEARKIDCFRIAEIEEIEIIEDTVPYFMDEEELGRRIFEEEISKQVCQAITNMTMACAGNAPEHQTKGLLESLANFVSTYSQGDKTNLVRFKKLCYEIALFESKTAMAAIKEAAIASKVYKPSVPAVRKTWKPSDRLMEAATRAADRHRLGMSVNDACRREGLSSATYYAAMRNKD